MMSCVLPCWLSEATIGIIIGSLFTLSGVFANGIVTYYLNRNAHNREVGGKRISARGCTAVRRGSMKIDRLDMVTEISGRAYMEGFDLFAQRSL